METNKKEPYGFAGWLKFFVLMGLYVGPIVVFLSLFTNLYYVKEVAPHLLELSGWETYKYLICTSTLIGVSYTCYCFYNLKTKFVPSSVQRMKVLLLVLPVIYFIVEILLLALVLQVLNKEVFMDIFWEFVKSFLKSSLVFYLYLTFSKRVKNTYYS